MRVFLFCLCLLSSYSCLCQQYHLIIWEDLKPHPHFKDPFKKLSSYELYKLGSLAKIEQNTKNKDLSKDDKKRRAELQNWLAQKNIDYKHLLAIQDRVETIRKEQLQNVNRSLDHSSVEISGYLLPLNFQNEKANEFLLVPWVGACIHTPAPAKNQIIYIKTAEWIDAVALFEPVSVSGKIQILEAQNDLFLSDGTSQIASSYSIFSAQVHKN